jgi:cell division septation protein DedD
MEPALKQRLIGAMVLVALAVIFLPMLIKGPAPESGVSDVPLSLPNAPQGEFETRELPLVSPGNAPDGGAVGMEQRQTGDTGHLPTVDTTAVTGTSEAGAGSDAMLPAATAAGDYAVSFGSYASRADASRVVAALTASQLPAYQEPSPASGGRTLYRVRVGPFATQAEAEAARLRAAHVRDDVGAKVVVLNADKPTSGTPATTASVSQPTAAAATSVSASVALPETKPATKPTPIVNKPVEAKPVAAATVATQAPAKPADAIKPVATAKPAAAGVGFAVQLGAFGSAAEANKLRDRARAAGFSAFVQEVRTDKGTLSRVRIGPVVDRAGADQLKSQVAAKLGVSGIVQPHP